MLKTNVWYGISETKNAMRPTFGMKNV